jgi:hypothetical protein
MSDLNPASTAFSFGTTLISNQLSSIQLTLFTASAGAVVNIFLAILIGSFSLALLAPEMQGTFSTCVFYATQS